MSEHQDDQSKQQPESQQPPMIVNKQGEVKLLAEKSDADSSKTQNATKQDLQQNTVSQKNITGSKMPEHTNHNPQSSVKQNIPVVKE